MALEDRLFDRFGVTSLVDGPSAGLFELVEAVPLEPLFVEIVGRTPDRLGAVEGLIPFAWGPDGDVRTHDVDEAMQTLPHVVPGPGPLRYFGADERTPPFLWTSFESPGLQLGGVVVERDWSEWTRAFAERLSRFSLRDVGAAR